MPTLPTNTPGIEHLVIETIAALLVELKQESSAAIVPGSDLAAIGVDSLARMELLVRLEKLTQARLGDAQILGARTVNDLITALTGARHALPRESAARTTTLPSGAPPSTTAAAGASTWAEVLEAQARQAGTRDAIHLFSGNGDWRPISYAALFDDAAHAAAAYLAHGVAPQQPVAIMLPTGREFFASCYGAWLAGAVPVPLYPPARLEQIEDHLLRQAAILNNCMAHVLVMSPELLKLAPLLRLNAAGLAHILTPEQLTTHGALAAHIPAAPDSLALLQYTSGSTGTPKGVMLSHANLLANVRAMGRSIGVRADDAFVSWLPLYHDMGLIGACLGTLYHGVPLHLMSPLHFIARPARWLRAIHERGGTLSAAPNFAYSLVAHKLGDNDLADLDLSRWRIAFNGAEPVSARVLDDFATRLAPKGFRREALLPVYGLAENCLGLAFPPLGRAPRIERFRRPALERDGRAEVADADDPDASTLVACGLPLPDHDLRIVDARDNPQPEHRVGRIQFRGPSSSAGYYRHPEATRAFRHGDAETGWRDSGDLGFLAEGEIFITGRAKEVIIRAGRNFYPYELEEAIGRLPGLRPGSVAVFAHQEADQATERLVVLAEARAQEPARHGELRAAITELCGTRFDLAPDDIVLAPPRAIPRTSSGKIRRGDCQRLYAAGTLGRAQPAWRQMLGIALHGLPRLLPRLWQTLTGRTFPLRCRALLALSAPPMWLILQALPGLGTRRSAGRRYLRGLARACGIPLHVHGLEHLPQGPCILCANHASYLDGPLLTAVLPPRFAFVAKQELRETLFMRRLFGALGAIYVRREDAEGGVQDAATLAIQARAGESLIFFPEGTFRRAPGLLPFRMGAFVVATRTGLPILPVAIRGTRAMLPDGSSRPSRGTLSVVIEPPIAPDGEDFDAALRLRGACREAILRHCGERAL
jgi:1-acyl-sn-glycerol-3-phosphate acyltransferase